MRLALEHIKKKYTYKTVLSDVTIDFAPGKIHSLLGENGAGKSTTAAIMSGSIRPDGGCIRIDGALVTLKHERDALRRGIAFVRQRPLLADSITVRENMLLGCEYGIGAATESANVRSARMHALSRRFLPQRKLSALAAHCGGDERFFIAFISALLRNPQLLILDEPSALLDADERKRLYAFLQEETAQGMTVVVITHNKEEAAQYSDTVTVLDEGKVSAHYADGKAFPLSQDLMQCKAMSGTLFGDNVYAKRTPSGSNLSVTFSHITVRPTARPALFDIGFTAHAGRITLITGTTESGMGTLENVITGMEHSPQTGTVTVANGDFSESIALETKKYTPAFLRKHPQLRAAIVPTDRTFRASHPNLSIEYMLTAMYAKSDTSRYADTLIANASVNIIRSEPASALSGGMLQRLILTRELDTDPAFIIFCEPLQGLDSCAADNVVDLIAKRAAEGAAVIVLSSAGFPAAVCARRYRLTGGTVQPLTEDSHA